MLYRTNNAVTTYLSTIKSGTAIIDKIINEIAELAITYDRLLLP